MSNSSMEYRPLGQCGAKVSALSLGGWTTFGGSVKDESMVTSIITEAFEAGVNFFDIADAYAAGEAERIMGKVFKRFPRNELVISSKVFFPISHDINDRGLSRKHIMESIDRSLRNIGTDYLDIYFCHRYDAETPLEETVRAMDDLTRQGKILYWGTSEWTGNQLRNAHAICNRRGWDAPQVEQPQYSLLFRERFESDVRPSAEELGMGLVVWSPLASGVLTGKYDDGIPAGSRLDRFDWIRQWVYSEEKLEKVRRFRAVAEELGVSRAQLAIAWALRQPGVSSVITGATTIEQIRENLKAATVAVTGHLFEELSAIF